MKLIKSIVITFLIALTVAVDYRLETSVVPNSYNITIQPYIRSEDGDKQFTFDGIVEINVNVSKNDVKTITVHTKNLNVSSAEVYSKDLVLPTDKDHTYDTATNKFTIHLKDFMTLEQSYQIRVSYKGQMDDDLHGFYRSSYTKPNGEVRWVGATQLQRIEARRVFPCFDEPQLKATFQLNIVRPTELKSFSNTKLLSTVDDIYGWKKDIFDRTPVMSTYLVAFLVSDFEGRYNDDSTFAVISRPEYFQKTEKSFEIGQKVLHAYEDKFGINYKDMGNELFQMASVPTFTHNGMENWGLILYKERVLVYEEGYTSVSGMQYMITILAHEICHMWFGNLVTFEWWGYFWLNEAFARYYQFYLSHELYFEYELDKQFVVDQMHLIFNTDANYGVAKLTDPTVASPSEIGSMFSSITYVKGASIVRQIRHAMGEERFLKSLQNYLSENKFKSTTPDHIFKHFKENWPSEQNVNLDEYFEDWFEKVGYPLVTVVLSSDGKSLKVRQERFLLNRHDGSVKDFYYTVPFTYTTNWKTSFTNTTPCVYLSNKPGKKEIINLEVKSDWVVANIQQTGYYRVNYDRTTWLALRDALFETKWSNIDEINRAQIVDDLFALGKTGYLSYDFIFDILEYLKTETAYLPWKPAFTGLKNIETRLGNEHREHFQKLIVSLTNKVSKKLGFNENEGELILDIYNREKITSWTCKYGKDECLSSVQKQMQNYLQENKKPSVNLRASVYCAAMREPKEKDFNSFLIHYETETYGPEREIMIESIGCVKVKKLVEKLFEIILSDRIPNKDHKKVALTSLYSENQENVDLMFNLVTKQYQDLINALSESDVSSILTGIAGKFTNAEQKNQLELFIDHNLEMIGSQEAKLRRSLDTVEDNLEWSRQHLPPLITYLKERANGAPSTACGLILMSFSILALYFLG